MIEPYIPPSRWWRRRVEIRITIWPTWLAQKLCPHKDKHAWSFNADWTPRDFMCGDCNKVLWGDKK